MLLAETRAQTAPDTGALIEFRPSNRLFAWASASQRPPKPGTLNGKHARRRLPAAAVAISARGGANMASSGAPPQPRTPDAASLAARFGLAGRTALVTGGSRGIGRAVAEALAAAGARVFVCALRDSELSDAVAQMRAAGYDVQASARPPRCMRLPVPACCGRGCSRTVAACAPPPPAAAAACKAAAVECAYSNQRGQSQI